MPDDPTSALELARLAGFLTGVVITALFFDLRYGDNSSPPAFHWAYLVAGLSLAALSSRFFFPPSFTAAFFILTGFVGVLLVFAYGHAKLTDHYHAIHD